MFNRRSLSFMAAIAIAALGGGGFSHSAPAIQTAVSKKAKRGLFNRRVYSSPEMLLGRKGVSMTCAQQKRNATKQRNQLRNKRVCRG